MSHAVVPPLVSVLVPTYNRGALLLEAVRSICDQTYPYWELVIADDGSTDGSLDRLPIDRRIRVIGLPHSGNVAQVRQAALDAAAGDFVGFLDSDDRWLPGKLAAQVGRLNTCPYAGWCFGEYRLINQDGAAIPLRAGVRTTSREGRLFDAFILGAAGISIQSLLVRTDLARAVGFDPRVRLCEDLDFMIRLAQQAEACRVHDLVAEVREHPQRSTSHRYDQHWHLARAFWRYRRLTVDPALRRACVARSFRYARTFAANVTAGN